MTKIECTDETKNDAGGYSRAQVEQSMSSRNATRPRGTFGPKRKMAQRKQAQTRQSRALPSFPQLRTFQSVADLGGISKAALELHRSQSAVSEAIQKLEDHLGTVLLMRTPFGCKLTECGEALVKRIDAFFHCVTVAICEAIRSVKRDHLPHKNLAHRISRSQILALVKVDEYGSFSKAARNATVSVPTLHRSIRSFEEQLGISLLDQTPTGLKVSAVGKRLSDQLRGATEELDQGIEQARVFPAPDREELVIGIQRSVCDHVVFVALRKFMEDYKSLPTRIHYLLPNEALSELGTGRVDIIFTMDRSELANPHLIQEEVFRDRFVVAARKEHPLTQSGLSGRSDLGKMQWIAPTSRRSIIEKLVPDRIAPDSCREWHSIACAIVMLSSSDSMTVLLRSELALDKDLGERLAALDCEIDHDQVSMGMVYRRVWKPKPAQRTFLNSLRHYLTDPDNLFGASALRDDQNIQSRSLAS